MQRRWYSALGRNRWPTLRRTSPTYHRAAEIPREHRSRELADSGRMLAESANAKEELGLPVRVDRSRERCRLRKHVLTELRCVAIVAPGFDIVRCGPGRQMIQS